MEVFEHILSFVNFYGLEECLLVDKTFNDIILGSPKLMNRFVFHIHGYKLKDSELKKITSMKRRYQKIKIQNMDANQLEIAIAGIQEVACKATEVRIHDCAPPVSSPLLPCFPNVVKLELKRFSGSSETLSPTLFPKLKHLKLHYASNVS